MAVGKAHISLSTTPTGSSSTEALFLGSEKECEVDWCRKYLCKINLETKAMGGCCQPGLELLAREMLRNVDFDSVTKPSVHIASEVKSQNPRIVKNGTILTLRDGKYSPAEAMVIHDGQITYVGGLPEAEKAAGFDADITDLKCGCALPGFIEPHLHLVLTALVDNYMVSLSPLTIKTRKEAIEKLKQHIKKVSKGQWVISYGYDPSRVEDHLEFTRDILDNEVSSTIPLWIDNLSGHLAYVNTALLTAAKIPDGQATPGFQMINGRLTGVVFEAGIQRLASSIPSCLLPSASDYLHWAQKTLKKWASKGCTTINDNGIGVSGASEPSLIKAITTNSTTVAIRFYGALAVTLLETQPPLFPVPDKPPVPNLGNAIVSTIKFWADGSTQGFTAALRSPYLSFPDYAMPRGILTNSDATLSDSMALYLQKGFRLSVHANGDRAVDQTLDVFETIFKAYPQWAPEKTGIVHRIEHFTVVHADQLSRAKNLSVSVSHTIGHVQYWGPTFQDYVLGSPRAVVIDPVHSDEKQDLIWSLHSDSPVTEVDPLLYLRTATTRMMYPGDCVLGPEERVDLETALKGITVNPAKQLGVWDKAGSLEVGKHADFVILEKDPRSVKAADLNHLSVEETWVGGQLVYARCTH